MVRWLMSLLVVRCSFFGWWLFVVRSVFFVVVRCLLFVYCVFRVLFVFSFCSASCVVYCSLFVAVWLLVVCCLLFVVVSLLWLKVV